MVLAMLVSVPALHVFCAISCDPPDRVQGADGCPYHRHHTDGPRVVKGWACCLDSVASAGVATIAKQHSALRPAPVVERIGTPAGMSVGTVETPCVTPSRGRPPGSFGIPLRV
jgi:hypothetical protein